MATKKKRPSRASGRKAAEARKKNDTVTKNYSENFGEEEVPFSPSARGPSAWKPRIKGRREDDTRIVDVDYVYYLPGKKGEGLNPHIRIEKFVYADGSKEFFQSHWDHTKTDTVGQKWRPGTKGLRKYPYNLQAIIDASPEEPIFITEGEKDADSVIDLGLIGTTNPNGAGNWAPELNRWFKGKEHVYILQDNDATGRRHALMVANQLVNIVKEVKIILLPNLPEYGDVSDWIKRGKGRNGDALLAYAQAAKPYQKIVPIDIRTGEVHLIAAKIEQAMVERELRIFKRSGQLVEPIWDDITDRKGRKLRVCGFRNPTTHSFAELAAKHAVECFRVDIKGNRIKAYPTAQAVNTILERGHWGFDPVVGIVNSPTMRPDGSLLTDPHYDVDTRLCYEPTEDITLSDIPERPTKADAEAALKLFEDLLSEVAFVDDVGRAVGYSAILTTVARAAFHVAPLFMFYKPMPGTGASYLSDIIATIATGTEAVPLASATGSPEEMTKSLHAAISEARPILFLDNLMVDLQNPTLSMVVSKGKVSIRPFNQNVKTLLCDCRATTVLANGNNVSVVGELVRRSVICHLKQRTDTPETTVYNKKPIEMVKADRGKYISAALTIILAYREAGSPEVKVEPLAGYEEWTTFVRNPLIWLGCEDPVKSQEEARERDPERNAHRYRLSALAKYFTGRTFTAADVCALATEKKSDFAYRYQDLFDAFAIDNKPTNSNSIGKWLRKDEEVPWGECYIELVRHTKTRNSYRVVGLPPGVTPYRGPDDDAM